MMGKPVVAGTRITVIIVESILEKLVAGESKEQIVSEQLKLNAENRSPGFCITERES